MPTVSDLGRAAKQKYPGAYDDVPDAELGRLVKQKYPGAYDDFTEEAPAQAALPSAGRYKPAAGATPSHDVEVTVRPSADQTLQEVGQFMDTSLKGTPKDLAAMGISTVAGVGGALIGGAVAGPPGALVGEMAGSLAGRKANVALGLEEPGVGGDILSTAGPLASRAIALGARAVKGVMPKAAQEVAELGEQHGVRLSYGDMTRQPTAQRAEILLESVPVVGTGRFRAAQQVESKVAAEEVAAKLQDKMITTKWSGLRDVEKAAKSGNKAAQHLLTEIQAAGDDWARIVQASGKVSLFQDNLKAAQLYDRVSALASPLGDFPVSHTVLAVRDSLDAVDSAAVVSPEVRSKVQGLLGQVRDAITPHVQQQSAGPSSILGPNGQPMQSATAQTVTIPADTGFDRLRMLRSEIGDVIREANDPQTIRHLTKVKTALEEDMDRHIAQHGPQALKEAWKEADTFYRTRVVPYRSGLLANAIEKDLPDEIYQKFTKQGADRAQFFYNGLEDKGRAAVRFGMVNDALDTAIQESTEVFSPAKFAGSLERHRDASGVFFKGRDKWELDGFTKLMRHVERAGAYGENPPTGQRLIPLLIGGGVASFSPGAAAGGAASTAGLSWLLTSKRGRSLLLAASDLKAGTPAMERVAEAMTREVTRIVGTGALTGEEAQPR